MKQTKLRRSYMLLLSIPLILSLCFVLLDVFGFLKNDLFKAIEKNNIELVEEIILKNNQKAKTYFGSLTPLHQAALYGRVDIGELLIEYSADVNAKGGRHNFSPIYISISREDLAFVNLLIKNGADINIRDDLSQTPLIAAAKTNNAQIIKVLVASGADTKIKDEEGKIALDYAKKNKIEEIIKQEIKERAK